MEKWTLRMPPSLLQEMRERAGLAPLSKIIRELCKMWVAGKIDIEQSGKDE